MKKLISTLLVLILTGCAANGLPQGIHSSTPKGVIENTKKVFVGVPLLLGMEGSSAKLKNGWMVTAAHNKLILEAQFKQVYYHPTCDIALYREDNNLQELELGLVYEDQPVYHVGYPMGMPISVHEGVYTGEVLNPVDKCLYSATDAVSIGGMSGGGVVNSKGELVGVSIGFMSTTIKWENGKELKSPSVFMPLLRVENWIEEITGENIYD